MQGVTHPVVKDVLLVGAGHSHVTVLRMFGMKPIPGVRFTLISREVHTPYSGMLPGLIAGHYDPDDAHIDTGPLARFAGARLYQDEVVALDLAARRVVCRGRPPVPYDLLSFNIGSTPNTADVPGAGEHAIPVKPIDGFLSRFEALVAACWPAKGARGSPLSAPAPAASSFCFRSNTGCGRKSRAQASIRAACRSCWCPAFPRSCRAFQRLSAPAFARSSPRVASRSSAAHRSAVSKPNVRARRPAAGRG